MNRIPLSAVSCLLLTPLAAEPVRLVATSSLLADWVLELISSPRLELHVLTGPGEDLHVYRPTPRDRASLEEAERILAFGSGVEPWLDQMRLGTDRIDVTRLVPDRKAIAGDPHAWLDPLTVRDHILPGLADELHQLFPEEATELRARREEYEARLTSLHEEITATLQTVPASRRTLVADHDALGWFAQRYDFATTWSLTGSPLTHTHHPSPRQVAELVSFLREHDVPAVFADSLEHHAMLQAAAREAKVPVVKLYLGNLGPENSGAETYLELMRQNAQKIAEALAP